MTDRSPGEITQVEGFELSLPLSRPFGRALGFVHNRNAFLVRITTACGLQGWGECGLASPASFAAVREILAPLIIGHDAQDMKDLWSRMAQHFGIDNRGATAIAASSIDMALWDVAARIDDVSLAQKLGGAARKSMEAYASGPYFTPGSNPYDEYAREMDRYLDMGFNGVKMRIGSGDAQKDGAIARQMRSHCGDDFMLMADLNGAFDRQGAKQIIDEMAAANLKFIEEPVQSDNFYDFKKLVDSAEIAITGGEALVGLHAFRDFLTFAQPAMVQPDLSICGGITECQRITALAQSLAVPVSLHVWGTSVGFNASLQFSAAMAKDDASNGDQTLIEVDMSENPYMRLGCELDLALGGQILVTDTPGIGVEIKNHELEPFTANHWSVT